METATVITDGSADNTRGTGGWCAIIKVGSSLTELTGWEESTTSNRMELLAAIEGLRAFKTPTKIHLVSDSTYMLKTLKNKWYERWFEENQEHRPNLDLWRLLVGLVHFHDVEFTKVKGHSGNYWNDRADVMAKKARKEKLAIMNISEHFDETKRCEHLGYNDKQCQLVFGHLSGHYYSTRKWKWED